MSRETRLAKKMGIYTIGNFGSKILTFLMVPYYTYCLSTDDYGYYDLLYTTISLLTPLITMQTTEAIISGCIDEKKDNHQIIKATSVIMIINSFIYSFAFFIFLHFFGIRLGGYFLGSLCATGIMGIIQQYARGLGKASVYAISGIAYTLIFLSLNIINLSILKTGVAGLFISNIIASVLVIIGILINVKDICKSYTIKLEKKYLKWVITYSLPLIPNAMCWWLINASDRYVIKWALNDSANGIYAVSTKFAAIIGTISTLVYYSWQEISLEEFKSKDKAQFYSNAFNSYMKIMLGAALVAISMTRFVVTTFTEASYHDAWKYASMLYVGTVFTGLASFLNTVYLATGKTKEILIGTLIAGLVNLGTDILTIQFIGIHAASLSTLLSAAVLLIRRIHDNKKYYDLKIEWRSLIILFSLCMIAFFISYITNSLLSQILFVVLSVLIVIPFNIVFIKRIGNIIERTIAKMKKTN